MTFEKYLCLAYRVAPEHGGERLDRFLAAAVSEQNVSRTRVKSLIEAGHASIDGATVKDPSQLLRAGQTAGLHLPPPAIRTFGRKHSAANRLRGRTSARHRQTSGPSVHPAGGHETGTLVNALIAHCGASLSGIGGVKRPGIVHRLDKDTSGLLVVAKTDAAHHGLAKLFAITGKPCRSPANIWPSFGHPARPSGTIDASLAVMPPAARRSRRARRARPPR